MSTDHVSAGTSEAPEVSGLNDVPSCTIPASNSVGYPPFALPDLTDSRVAWMVPEFMVKSRIVSPSFHIC